MKKILLSTFTIVSFVVYGLYQRAVGTTLNDTPTNVNQTFPTPSTFKTAPRTNSNSPYKNGTYTGPAVDAYYGFVQIRVVINNNRINDIVFLQYPNDRQRSAMINSYAMPILKQEAIQSQSAKVNLVSGATDSSQAFIRSLNSALSNAI